MTKQRIFQTIIFVISIILILWGLYSASYYILLYSTNAMPMGNFSQILDMIVDWIIVLIEIIAGVFGIVQYIKLTDDRIDNIFRIGTLLLCISLISLLTSIFAGEFSGVHSVSEISESIIGISAPAIYFVFAFLLNRIVE